MKKKKTILLGGLILILALGVYAIVWAVPLKVSNDLDFDQTGGPYKVIGLDNPSARQDAATWGYVQDAVNGLDPDQSNVGIWRQDETSNDVYLNNQMSLSGNVGIGTTDPSGNLHIYDTNNSAGIKIQSGELRGQVWSIYSSKATKNLAVYLHDDTSPSTSIEPNVITFSGNGKIGIGTTSPRQHLSIGSYLDIYDGAAENDLGTSSIRSSIENLAINGPDVYGGLYLNYDNGRGVKFFAHPDATTTLQIAELNDSGDLSLKGTLNVGNSGYGESRDNYVYGKLGVGKILNPGATLDIIDEIGDSDMFKVSYLEPSDFSISYLLPISDVSPYQGFSSTEATHYEAVNDYDSIEGTPVDNYDEDTYITGGVGEREANSDWFHIDSLTGDVYSIDYVKVTAVCKSSQTTNPAFVSPIFRVGEEGTIYSNDTFTEVGESYQTITLMATQNPNNGSPLDWTKSNINELQIGVQARGGPVPPEGPPQNPSSFIAGTKILMADGGYKNIEKIKAGDKVISFDIENKLFVDNEVIARTNGHKAYLLINDKLGLTLNQKVYVVDKGFVQAKELRVGDYLLNESKKNIRINSIEKFPKKVDVYDLVLESPHNFFANGYLVHNIVNYGVIVGESGVECTQIYAEVSYVKLKPESALVVNNAGNVAIGDDAPGSFQLKVASAGGANPVYIGDNLSVGGTAYLRALNVDGDAIVSRDLSVNGLVQTGGTGSETCGSGTLGAMRYYESSGTAYFQVCMNSSTGPAWYTIESHSTSGA